MKDREREKERERRETEGDSRCSGQRCRVDTARV